MNIRNKWFQHSCKDLLLSSHIHEKAINNLTATRQLERFHSSEWRVNPRGHRKRMLKSPMKLQVYPRRLLNPDLEQGDVESIDRSEQEREEVSQYWG